MMPDVPGTAHRRVLVRGEWRHWCTRAAMNKSDQAETEVESKLTAYRVRLI